MSDATWAGASVCQSCKRMVRHKPVGGPHRRHGCRLRWIARRVAQAESRGWDDGYRFAVENISDPMVYADLSEYGTGWAGLIAQGGLTIWDPDCREGVEVVTSLTDFLLSRIAEDEARWEMLATASATHGIATFLLAECEAKRQIVNTPPTEPMDDPRWRGYHLGWRHMHDRALRRLALPYADHPDYRETWRV